MADTQKAIISGGNASHKGEGGFSLSNTAALELYCKSN